jgi:hypothetical protein
VCARWVASARHFIFTSVVVSISQNLFIKSSLHFILRGKVVTSEYFFEYPTWNNCTHARLLFLPPSLALTSREGIANTLGENRHKCYWLQSTVRS